MDWIRDHAWESWLVLAALLGVAELFSLEFVLVMLAVGALGGSVTAALGGPLVLQAVLAIVTAVAMLWLVRPTMARRLHSGPELTLGHAALVGRQGQVLSTVDAHQGQIRVAGEVWTARPFDETVVIPEGATVDILEIRGATALVHPVPELDS